MEALSAALQRDAASGRAAMNAGQFQPGSDDRRHSGAGPRAPRANTIKATIRREVGSDIPALTRRLRILSESGDPAASAALAQLLAASLADG